MKLKKGFALRSVAGRNVVIPIDEDLNMNLMISLNDTGVFLWRLLEKGTTEEEMCTALAAEYEVDAAAARADIITFIENCKENDFIEEI